jgi:hypothetical protein
VKRKIRDRIVEWLGGVPKADASTARARAYEAGYEDGNDEPSSGDLRSFGYRRASSGAVREFGGLDYDKVLDTAWKVWLMSPLAKRALQIKRDYICGSGVTPSSDDENLQTVLEDFWQINHLDERAPQYVLQRHLLGEQIFPAFVRATDGQVRLGYIDPIQIEKIIQHPDNSLERWAVVLKEESTVGSEPWRTPIRHRQVFRIIRRDEGALVGGVLEPPQYDGKLITAEQATLEEWELAMLDNYGLPAYTGSCFYFQANALANQPRGYSDLLQVVDWIDQDETVLFDLADREAMAGFFIADVTLIGADKGTVRERSSELRASPPKKGSVRVHNDQEMWNLDAPDLKQPSSVETHRAVETHAWGGMGLPNSWYGHGDETNRATAAAQGDPTWKTMTAEQNADKSMFVEMLTFARDQAEIAGGVAWQPEATIDLQMPEMTTKDLTAISSAMGQIALALTQAEQNGWQTRQHSVEAWAKLMAEIDVDLDVDAEIAEVDAEQEQGDLGAADDMNSWLNQHGFSTDDTSTEIQFANTETTVR